MRERVYHVVDAQLIRFVGQIYRVVAVVAVLPVLGDVVVVIDDDLQAFRRVVPLVDPVPDRRQPAIWRGCSLEFVPLLPEGSGGI